MEGEIVYAKLVGLAKSCGAANLLALARLTSGMSRDDYLVFHQLFMIHSSALLPLVELIAKQSREKSICLRFGCSMANMG